jgi:flagellar biosynthetic protein FliQ
MLGIGMIVGLLVAIFQTVTTIQEQTLTFVPKIIAILISIAIFGPWMLNMLIDFINRLFALLPKIPG